MHHHIHKTLWATIAALVIFVSPLLPQPVQAVITNHGVFGTADDYYALVTNSADGTVSVLSLASGSVIDTIRVGDALGTGFNSAPGCIAITPDNRWALVTYQRPGANRLIVLAIAAIGDGIDENEIVDTIDLAHTDPEEGACLAVTPDAKRAYVVGGRNFSDIAVVDLTTVDDGVDDNEVSWIDREDALHHSVAISPDGTRAYITDHGFADALHVLDIDPDSDAYNTIVASVYLGDQNTFAKGVAITPDGTRTYVADSSSFEEIYVIDTDPLSAELHTIIDEIHLSPLNNSPNQVTISPSGDRVFVSRATHTVVIDAEPTSLTYHQQVQQLYPQQTALWGQGSMALTADENTLLVINEYRDSVSIFDLQSGVEVYNVPVGADPKGIALYRPPITGRYVKVVDESGVPVKNAEVYRNEVFVGLSDERGIVAPEDLSIGDTLVAMLKVEEQASPRPGHQSDDDEAGWSFRIYTTNMNRQNGMGDPISTIVDDSIQQLLTIDQSSVLVLFNLIVSIEWDAHAEYIAEIEDGLRDASNYLYDVSDGQMALGRVTIADRSEHWSEADIQIGAANFGVPYSYINGILSSQRAHVVRLNRYWNGDSSSQGAWSEPDGYRTITHELGHFALGLYDEYFVRPDNGGLSVDAFCPVHRDEMPVDDATSASIMSYQYKATELSALGVPGLWSEACEHTEHWRHTEESPWQTLVRQYTAAAAGLPASEQWQFITPMDRGRALAGPDVLTPGLPQWPEIIVSQQSSDGTHTIDAVALDPENRPVANVGITLYKQDGQAIDQGLTGSDGHLEIVGSVENEIVRAATILGDLVGIETITSADSLVINMAPVIFAAATQEKKPFLRVIPGSGQDESSISLLFSVQGLSSAPTPILIMTEPSEASYAPVKLDYRSDLQSFIGNVNFSASKTGTGHLQISDGDNISHTVHSIYRLQRISNTMPSEVYSDGGALSLHLEAGSFPATHSYLAISSLRGLPGSIPQGKQIIGDAYDVTASGAIWQLETGQSALMRLYYDPSLLADAAEANHFGIYRWHPGKELWCEIDSQHDKQQHALSGEVTTLGSYALMAPMFSGNSPAEGLLNRLYLPYISNSQNRTDCFSTGELR